MARVGIESIGMFTSVGTNTAETVGSLMTTLQRFEELQLLSKRGHPVEMVHFDEEPVVGAPSPIPMNVAYGEERLVKMASFALQDCLENYEGRRIPLLLCLPEAQHLQINPRRLIDRIAAVSGAPIDVNMSQGIAKGRAAVVPALHQAVQLFASGRIQECLVAGVDSLLHQSVLSPLLMAGRIYHPLQQMALIPGEGAAAVRLTANPSTDSKALLRGVGAAMERPIDDNAAPVQGKGLTQAMREALQAAGANLPQVSDLVRDVAQEKRWTKELGLALARVAKGDATSIHRSNVSLCLGDAGASMGVLMLGYLAFGFSQALIAGPGAMAVHFSDGGLRGVTVLSGTRS